jgi:DNA (cytosine-5)-methyltransferase 1
MVAELNPRMITLENVPGMATLLSGDILNDIVERLEGMYYDLATWMLNSHDLGIPQSRKRLFVIGSREDELPDPPISRKERVGAWDAIADLPHTRAAGNPGQSVPIAYRSDPRSAYARSLRGRRSKVSNCEISVHSPSLVRRLRTLRWNERDERTWHRRLHPRKPAPTLTAGSRTRTACRPIHPFSDRVLTVREGARLASFPDWYVFPGHKAEAWSQIGNCVPPLMAERVFKRVRSCL